MANRFQLWGQAGWASAEVVGETHYAKSIRALFGADFNPQGTDLTLPVQLIPDRTNRHDRNAVGVWADSQLLGHLPRPEAARYSPVLTELTKRNLVPEVNAQIHGREWDGNPNSFDANIRLDLAEPHMLVPANQPPVQEHRLLPTGSAVQVNGQDQHLDALAPLYRTEGECWVYVTLQEMADHLVEVRLGDKRVGDLSPKMSGELLPVLRHQSERGLVTAARAIVKSTMSVEILLYIARVQDLGESWLGSSRSVGAVSGRLTPAPATTPVPPTSGSGAMPSFAGAGPMPPLNGAGPVPTWMTPQDTVPTWAVPQPAPEPTWMDRSELVPTWVQPSTQVPGWASSVSGPVPTIAGPTTAPPVSGPPLPPEAIAPTSPVPISPAPLPGSPVSGPGTLFGGPVDAPGSGTLFGGPVDAPGPGTLFGGPNAEIAETTVIPALTAVVMNQHAAVAAAAAAPVSPAPEENPHPDIPPAPTGVKFVVPPGWPTPPDGWYPPESWRPDPGWPLAPAGWQWWVPTWD
ncbi:hypothetical protein [Actinoplanes sp. NPDC051851]|uniref:hypothetical protein n=1 Tax=Actinoplanes sp. NPDC051851 TaxID=3154753 RepID=UPI003439BB10